MIGIQQISERMRTAPTQALRAVFAGIGRILLVADRPESRATTAQTPSIDNGSDRLSPRQPVATWRDLDKTGNVRLLSAEDMVLEFGVEQVGRAAAEADQLGQPSQNDQADATPATPPGTIPAVELPLAGYDGLSLASIRAHLRNLDVSQLRVLGEYERGHAERPEVLCMFERRIEKLEAGG